MFILDPVEAMTPPRLKPAVIEARRDAILDAALELFAERGFHGTAVPEVADRAGVGAGTIYRYFASKEAMVNALFQKYKGLIGRYVLDGVNMKAPAREQFHHFWSRMAQFAKEHPVAFAFLELHHHQSYLDEQSELVERNIIEFAEAFLRRTQARNEIKPLPPMLLIGLIMGAFTGVVRKCWEGKMELTDDVVADAEQCTWEAIRS
jgi:AcrR family transcriptional regulator